MSRSNLSLVMLTGLALAASTSMARAEVDNRDVVRDQRNNIVVNSFGNCVRTKWVSESDACGAEPARQRVTLSLEERTVYFDFNKSTLRPDARQRLDSLASTLKSDRDVKEAQIVGYADRIGSTSYNEKLSQRRAESVRKYLVSRGLLNTRVTETRWLGESVPATSCSNDLPRPELIECLQKDRRVEVEIQYYATGENRR